ncbi:SMI1/KNR4 family protein [Hymenobacter terrenus]|uniref:SMI1/KNR4 family protein n=1 Tax=Hymenobacter terrenus TaxID=1629124 RepID=UPI000619A55E|nr:SMI1/KNR4 family protein [Hymenobacter terrenus]
MTPHYFIGTQEPATLADIEAIEQQYGFTLPADYKAHLLQYNGGWPRDRDTFLQLDPVDGEHVERSVNQFKPVKNGDYTLESSLRSLRSELHDDLVPFANEAGGDQFVLSVGPEDYGSVYYISHEFYKPPKRKEMKQPRQYGKGVSFLAPSFTAFLDGLVDIPDDDDDDDDDE